VNCEVGRGFPRRVCGRTDGTYLKCLGPDIKRVESGPMIPELSSHVLTGWSYRRKDVSTGTEDRLCSPIGLYLTRGYIVFALEKLFLQEQSITSFHRKTFLADQRVHCTSHLKWCQMVHFCRV